MIADWQTNSVFFSELLPERHPAIWRSLEDLCHRNNIPVSLVPGCKDIWVRDFLPVQIDVSRFVQFVYHPDYLHGYEHLRTGSEVLAHLPPLGHCTMADLIVDGGNVVTSPDAAILTDKIFRENPGRAPDDVVAALQDLLEAEQVIIIPTDPDDEIGHADGVVRFLDRRTVAVNDYQHVNRRYGRQLAAVLEEYGLDCLLLPYFYEDYQQDGVSSAAGNYANFLRIGDLVIVPAYGSASDDVAIRRLEQALPGATIASVPCLELAREGGVLNCVSWTVMR